MSPIYAQRAPSAATVSIVTRLLNEQQYAPSPPPPVRFSSSLAPALENRTLIIASPTARERGRPPHILLLTFSNKPPPDTRPRRNILPVDRRLWGGTLHSSAPNVRRRKRARLSSGFRSWTARPEGLLTPSSLARASTRRKVGSERRVLADFSASSSHRAADRELLAKISLFLPPLTDQSVPRAMSAGEKIDELARIRDLSRNARRLKEHEETGFYRRQFQ